MANQSIYNAFERMWTHVVNALNGKADESHTHDEYTTTSNFDDAVDTLQSQVDSKASASDLTSHTSNKSNPHGVTAEQAGALPITGGTLTGTLYTSASTPIFIGADGKIGMRAKSDDLGVNNVGQINVSNAWWDTGNQWGAQMSGYNGETGKYNQLRVSHDGLEYIGEDDVSHQILHEGNYADYIDPSVTVSDITDLTATAAELNKLDGVTATTAELNRLAGVTSPIQEQIDSLNETFNTYFDGLLGGAS